MAGLDKNTKLFIPFDGTDGDTSTNDLARGHSITFQGNADLDNTYSKFGTTSGYLDGGTASFDVASSSDFDFFDNNTDEKTIDLWVKHISTGGDQTYFFRISGDSLNYYVVRHRGGSGTLILLYIGGATVINTGYQPAGIITDTNEHHWALVKKADVYAIYLDGVQKTYHQDTSTGTFTGTLNIGSQTVSSRFMNAYIADLRYQVGNPFGASPNVGITDTFSVPTSRYTILPNSGRGIVVA